MFKKLGWLALTFLLAFPSSVIADTTATQTVPGTYISPGTSPCPSSAITPCFVPNSNSAPIFVQGTSGGTSLPVQPPSVVPIPSSVGVSCQVIKASPGNLGGYNVVNLTNTPGFVEVINATSAPGDGALTGGTGSGNMEDFALLPANGEVSGSFVPALHVYSVGITICTSSAATPYTKTTGTITAAITGSTQ